MFDLNINFLDKLSQCLMLRNVALNTFIGLSDFQGEVLLKSYLDSSSSFTLYPPSVLSISRPEFLARSISGSIPTATIT